MYGDWILSLYHKGTTFKKTFNLPSYEWPRPTYEWSYQCLLFSNSHISKNNITVVWAGLHDPFLNWNSSLFKFNSGVKRNNVLNMFAYLKAKYTYFFVFFWSVCKSLFIKIEAKIEENINCFWQKYFRFSQSTTTIKHWVD